LRELHNASRSLSDICLHSFTASSVISLDFGEGSAQNQFDEN
jgi:hypothetical protein